MPRTIKDPVLRIHAEYESSPRNYGSEHGKLVQERVSQLFQNYGFDNKSYETGSDIRFGTLKSKAGSVYKGKYRRLNDISPGDKLEVKCILTIKDGRYKRVVVDPKQLKESDFFFFVDHSSDEAKGYLFTSEEFYDCGYIQSDRRNDGKWDFVLWRDIEEYKVY